MWDRERFVIQDTGYIEACIPFNCIYWFMKKNDDDSDGDDDGDDGDDGGDGDGNGDGDGDDDVVVNSRGFLIILTNYRLLIINYNLLNC